MSDFGPHGNPFSHVHTPGFGPMSDDFGLSGHIGMTGGLGDPSNSPLFGLLESIIFDPKHDDAPGNTAIRSMISALKNRRNEFDTHELSAAGGRIEVVMKAGDDVVTINGHHPSDVKAMVAVILRLHAWTEAQRDIATKAIEADIEAAQAQVHEGVIAKLFDHEQPETVDTASELAENFVRATGVLDSLISIVVTTITDDGVGPEDFELTLQSSGIDEVTGLELVSQFGDLTGNDQPSAGQPGTVGSATTKPRATAGVG